jgi:uncharacterized protein YndB with AHSA1/START domain
MNTLEITTPTDLEIVITRVFDAPRSLVFKAFTTPDLLKQWMYGPDGWALVDCEIDLRVGGDFRYLWRGPDGMEMGMRGVTREIEPPERWACTQTFEFGCEPQAGEQVVTAVLTEQGGKTTLTTTVLYPSKEARDGAAASGMEHGMEAGYGRLDTILTTTLGDESA